MIRARGISKSFKLYRKPSYRVREILTRRPLHRRYQALTDVSFSVDPGEVLGVIGRNGAGKSTLLKILNGVLLPDAGAVERDGRVTGLLELGTGFDIELSGLQNISVNGLLLGMTGREIQARRDSIIDFAELADVIDEPLRTYSTGMVMRLAFAVAIHATPRTFLIDEALSVGDAHFQQKCIGEIRRFRENGGAIVFVSHDLNAVKLLCDQALVLEHGRVVKCAEPEAAVNHYFQLIAGDTEPDEPEDPDNDSGSGYGNLQVRFEEAGVRGELSGSSTLASGEAVLLDLKIAASVDSPDLTVGMGIRDSMGQNLFGTNSYQLGIPLNIPAGDSGVYRFRFPCYLAPGDYTVSLALHEGPDHTRKCYHWWDRACHFRVAGYSGVPFGGVCDLSPELEVVGDS